MTWMPSIEECLIEMSYQHGVQSTESSKVQSSKFETVPIPI